MVLPSRRLVAGLAVLLVLLPAGCSKVGSQPTGGDAPTGDVVTCNYVVGDQPAKPVDPPAKQAAKSGTATVTMQLSGHPMTITMDRSKAPCTVNNFVSLATQKFFDNTKCHRLVDTGIFILQCGDPSGTGRGGPGYTFDDELTGKETYPKGTVAMANAGDNTNGSQFFICWDDTPLPPKYTVFGKIDDASLEAVTRIAAQGVDAGDQTSPIADATITKVTLG